MKIDVFAADSTAPSADSAFDTWLSAHPAPPDFVALHQSVPSRAMEIERRLSGVPALHGATSCLGVMNQDGPHISDGFGAFAIWDADGDYGTGLRALGDDSRSAAKEATQAALLAADRPGEAPDVIWLSCSPGTEEDVLTGVESVVGANVPILGGSAADNTLEGHWQVFDAAGAQTNGVIVSVLFPSKPISFAYHNGYAPTAHNGVVTKCDGRLLHEIDNRPAADVYREWTGHAVIPETVTDTTPILSESTLSPLGRHLDDLGGVPFYLLFHPSGLRPDGTLELFADTQVGDTLTLMHGAPAQLTQRAGKVAALASQSGDLDPQKVAGALMIYCGGCMLAVEDSLKDVSDGVKDALPNLPFLGVFTFGEQGPVMGGRNRHGNLMISVIVFTA